VLEASDLTEMPWRMRGEEEVEAKCTQLQTPHPSPLLPSPSQTESLTHIWTFTERWHLKKEF